MVKMLSAVAFLVLAFAGTAMACEAASTAMSTPTVTTAQGDGAAPQAPAQQTPPAGG